MIMTQVANGDLAPPRRAELVVLSPQVVLLQDRIEGLGGLYAFMAHQIGQARLAPPLIKDSMANPCQRAFDIVLHSQVLDA